jgi:two-component system, chemotaxis family, sensor histidine kinase and response regulator PixL
MSLNPDIRDQAYQFFIEEAQELLQVLETGLLEIRQDHSTPKVHELMRAAHSIKGGAASVELGAIELLAHRLEDFFKALYSDEVDFDGELESLLLQGYDCLAQPLTQQIEAGSFDEEAALLNAEPVFTALAVRLEDALKNADNYIPSSNDLGVDIVDSIFEVDVAQALEHLQGVAANPANFDPAAELSGTLEMFAGFAELFNLPGFSDIVQTAQTALIQNPHRAVEIINATIIDCTAAKEQVLAGDRQQGGAVSSSLKELALQTEDSVSYDESSIAMKAIALDQELWSSTPEPSAADIFASLADNDTSSELAEITLDQDNLWSSTPEPFAEDIFAAIPESAIEDRPETESTNDDLDQIFGIIPEQEIAPAESEATNEITLDHDNLWSSALEPFEDIFASPSEVADDSAAEAEIDIEPIFEAVPDTAEAEIDQESTAKIDNDNINDDIERILADSPDDTDTASTSITEAIAQSENLIAALDSIEEIFENLPQVDDEQVFTLEASTKQPAKSAKSQPPAAKPDKKTQDVPKLSVRVEMERLERMNNLVGELTINRNSLALQNDQLQENVSELGQKFLRFRGVTRKMREISDQMLLGQRSQPIHAFVDAQLDSSPELGIADEFDVLEMDRYSQLYSSLKELLEEMLQLEESVDDITIFAQQSDRTINSQRQMLSQMRDELMWVRMLPLDQILQRFPRTLRELANKYQKPVELKLNGTGVLVDKAVLEKLADPLLHLLRNSFDHGIEPPEIRTQQGKPAAGLIEIQAYYQGNQTVIEVRDDGQGLDLAKIRQKGIEQGLISPQEAANAPQSRLFDLIFEPGFSTASKVSELSGRGVGMNIVRSQIETLKGKIDVTSTPGVGSTFKLRLPLTLTIAKLLVCSLGSTSLAIPSDSIEEIIIPTVDQIKFANEQKFLSLNTKLIPIYNLKQVLQYNCPITDINSNSTAFKTIAPPEDWLAPLLLLRRGQQLFALEIVSLLSEQELVIKPYGMAIAPPVYSYGCTILGDGSLIPAFDGSALISTILGEDILPAVPTFDLALETLVDAVEPAVAEAIAPEIINTDTVVEQPKITSLKTIMIVDDSTALRRTMALTLEKEGYRVVQQKDGKEALKGFKQNPHLDLIICDVEMPVMNGFEFLGMRRRDSALAQVPTFMLTSRSGAKHRNLAKQLGADGYFTKPYVEQEFIQEINQILLDNHQLVNQDERGEIAAKTNKTKTKTILIIDDSSALRRTLALSLEQRGYRVLQGGDGNEGLQQLRDNLTTDLVICDVEMPNVDGFEFLTLRRKESQLAQIPVIMLTSRSSDKHRTLAINLGAAGFFTKPYVEKQFLAEIEQYLR